MMWEMGLLRILCRRGYMGQLRGLAIRSFWRVTCSAHGVDFVVDLAVEHNRKKKVQTKFQAFFSVGTCECDENESVALSPVLHLPYPAGLVTKHAE